ncbi:acylphosphatase [Arthrobacter sp. NPDC057388]|jgi:acylphosphatase|uniref:acylphosphatase n=1 Tax=Arthrobacter sp. NPDC057388 TaxID=3346116 RepID=UPI0036433A73
MTDSKAADPDSVRLTARVTGMVQGVGFRYWTARKADELGLTGSVRNDDDGSVAVVAEGPQPDIVEFRRWLGSSRAPGRVAHVDEKVSPAEGGFSSFQVVS